MKIVGICGSKRPLGNSESMVRRVLDSAKNAGAQTDVILLRNLHIEYCSGCDSCDKNGGNCVIEDGMKEVYPKLLEADVIILGTPNYFKNVSALTKNFMDRTNAFVRASQRKLKGKYAIGLCVGGEEIEDTHHCKDALKRFFKAHRMRILCMIEARADLPKEINDIEELVKRLDEIGRLLASKDGLKALEIRWLESESQN